MPSVITGSSPVTAVGLELDPDGSSVDLNDHTLYRLMSIDLPEPKVKSIYTGSFDTEGSLPVSEHGYENREITVTLMVFAGDSSSLLDMLSVLKQKQSKINREHNGVLRLTFPDGTAVDFDLIEAQGADALESGNGFVVHNRLEVTLSFVAKPFWRGEELAGTPVAETSAPMWIGNLPDLGGDVAPLGHMLATDTGGTDRWMLIWGRQSRYYDSAASAALYYPAESRTPLGGAATAVGATGATGAGSNVVRQGTLTPTMQAMLSTQASGGGAHLTHIGSFNVLARIYMPTTNTGAVSVALEWATGDFRRRITNDWVDFDAGHYRQGQYVVVRLGQVHIPEGTAQWEGRIVASSTKVGDDLDVDWFAFVPITEGSGELSALLQFETPTSFSARDEFEQSAGSLAGKTLPVGGTWSGAGDTDDFTIDTTNDYAKRTAVSDAGSFQTSPRWEIAGTATPAAIAVQADIQTNLMPAGGSGFGSFGVFARYTDTNNFIALYFDPDGGDVSVYAVAGGIFQLGAIKLGAVDYQVGDWVTVRLLVTAAGKWYAWAFKRGSSPGAPVVAGSHDELATGGGIATGKVGIFDWWANTAAATRNFDNFAAFVPTKDAAIFASQSLELTHEKAEREDSTGTFPSDVSSVRGDYLKFAPAGREGRTNRLIVIPFTNDIDTMGDPGGSADLTVEPTATPRGVSIPAS